MTTMISNLPHWISILFIISWLFALGLFYQSNPKSTHTLIGLIIWSLIQCILSYKNFYQVTDTMPPRFALVLFPPAIWIIWELLTLKRREVIRYRDLTKSTLIHTLRFPVEIVLWQLFSHSTIPELMTFEGRNFDIIMGITAPITGWLFIKNRISLKALRIWNIIGLILILFIMVNGILSAELPIQMFAFDQPNKGLAYFPFVLLPAIVVPLVIYTHITDLIKINQLLKSRE